MLDGMSLMAKGIVHLIFAEVETVCCACQLRSFYTRDLLVRPRFCQLTKSKGTN